MKVSLLITIIFNLASMTFAQVSPDSLFQKIGRVSVLLDIDSLERNLVVLPDSIRRSIQHTDSILQSFSRNIDSLKTSYQNVFSKIESESGKLIHKIDSLQQRGISSANHTKKLDSLDHVLHSTEAKFAAKLAELKLKTTDKLSSLDLPPEYKEPLEKLTQQVNGLSLDSDIVEIPRKVTTSFRDKVTTKS